MRSIARNEPAAWIGSLGAVLTWAVVTYAIPALPAELHGELTNIIVGLLGTALTIAAVRSQVTPAWKVGGQEGGTDEN